MHTEQPTESHTHHNTRRQHTHTQCQLVHPPPLQLLCVLLGAVAVLCHVIGAQEMQPSFVFKLTGPVSIVDWCLTATDHRADNYQDEMAAHLGQSPLVGWRPMWTSTCSFWTCRLSQECWFNECGRRKGSACQWQVRQWKVIKEWERIWPGEAIETFFALCCMFWKTFCLSSLCIFKNGVSIVGKCKTA